jgi:hypothetical protein
MSKLRKNTIMINLLKRVFSQKFAMSYQQRQIERYLSNSSDLVDLERRQRELTHGRFKL